jgi:ABC-type Mn2+/Zn2+ transport system ATPase subunit
VVKEEGIIAENLFFRYSNFPVLSNISFEIKKGEFVAITGPNGSGKTTLLKLILGILQPESGKITIYGHDSSEREQIQAITGFMPQREHISSGFPILVRDVMMMGISARKRLKKLSEEDEEIAIKALEAVGMNEEFLNRKFDRLSGGQKQRVLFARAIAVEPEILLLDEPFNGVDIPSQNRMLDTVMELRRKGKTVIIVVHNINPLLHHIDKLMLLRNRLIACGRIEEVLTEQNLRKAYGASIPIIYCEEGFGHPVYGDTH